jgi:hypothetical protein
VTRARRRPPLPLHGDSIPARQDRALHWRRVCRAARVRLLALGALYALFLTFFLLALPR